MIRLRPNTLVMRITILALLLTSLPAAPADAQSSIAELYRNGEPSCTTFSMSGDGSAWVTAAHCLKPGADGLAPTLSIHGTPVVIKAVYPTFDIAILVGPPTPRYWPLGSAPRAGDDVIVAGYFFWAGWHGDSISIFKGHVINPHVKLPLMPSPTEWANGLMLLSNTGNYGLSGAPVLKDDQVVGVWVGRPAKNLRSPQNQPAMSFATPFSHFAPRIIRELATP